MTIQEAETALNVAQDKWNSDPNDDNDKALEKATDVYYRLLDDADKAPILNGVLLMCMNCHDETRTELTDVTDQQIDELYSGKIMEYTCPTCGNVLQIMDVAPYYAE